MPRKISTILNVNKRELEKRGVFDAFIDLDSRLHIDPSLLESCKISEFQNTHNDFLSYFNNILTLITNHKKRGDKLWLEAHRRLQFKEIGSIALGYSRKGTGGNAIGPILAEKILDTVTQIVEAGIKDPIIFELVGMFEEGIGADRISDMTLVILFRNFLSYTQRVSQELNVATKRNIFNEESFFLPFNPGNKTPIILIPKNLLNHLPIANDWDDIDTVSKHNEALRQKVNKTIGKSWKAASRISKHRLKEIILQNPELLIDLIRQYKEKPKISYDFNNDPIGEVIWAELSEKAPIEFPLNLMEYNPVTAENILTVVKQCASELPKKSYCLVA